MRDRASLDDIDVVNNGIAPGNNGLRKRWELFKGKTWLVFSVVKGGDAALWGRRRALIKAEQAVVNKKSTSAVLLNAGYERAGCHPRRRYDALDPKRAICSCALALRVFH